MPQSICDLSQISNGIIAIACRVNIGIAYRLDC